MTQYRYHLDKTSKKFNCPKCGKKSFVKYIETETGHYADSQYGRCDREIKCGYFEYPNSNSIINYNYVKLYSSHREIIFVPMSQEIAVSALQLKNMTW